jgi:hypothetical protein
MANPERGEVGVTVGGKPYTLRPTFDALCELEAVENKPIDQILRTIEEGRLSSVRAVTWCLLQDQHAAEFPTLKHASRFIEELGGADQAVAVLYRVMGLNAEPEAGAENPPTAQAGTGSVSAETPVTSV